MKNINKAVFPVAGLGSRFLPITKSIPKEMLPIINKPLIQYAVEEAVMAGITELVFIISKTKNSIIKYFDRNNVLEESFSKDNKLTELASLREIIPENVSCTYINQEHALGLGHAVLCAKPAIGENSPFVVILPDDLVDIEQNATQALINNFKQKQSSVIAVEDVAREETHKYGITETSKTNDVALFKVNSIKEKPKPTETKSRLGVVGRYVFSSAVFACLERTKKGINNEIQLTDAISLLLKTESVFAHKLAARRYDCGSKLGYTQASVNYALKEPDIKKQFHDYLISLDLN